MLSFLLLLAACFASSFAQIQELVDYKPCHAEEFQKLAAFRQHAQAIGFVAELDLLIAIVQENISKAQQGGRDSRGYILQKLQLENERQYCEHLARFAFSDKDLIKKYAYVGDYQI